MSRGRIVEVYRAVALLSLNTLLLLLLINLAAVAALSIFPGLESPPPGALGYGMERLKEAYPGQSEREIEALLRETWSRRYVYEPFVQHREGALSGRFVNIGAEGFRMSSDQGSWPPSEEALNIFVFGGSTTFGYGVADDQTIPSRLQRALSGRSCGRQPRVYNFGRGNYYGEQERVLFQQLLAAGRVPDVAVFIDGLNEWKTAPKFTARLDYMLAESRGQLVVRALKTLPIVRLLRALRRGGGGGDTELDGGAERELALRVVERWLRGKRMIEAVAAEFDVLPLFVWQPVPTWEYDMDAHRFAVESASTLSRHGSLRQGYEEMNRIRPQALEPSGNFLWLANIQRGRRESFYVDAAHYNAEFSDEIARGIAEFVVPRLGCAPPGRE